MPDTITRLYIRNGNDKASYQLLKEAHGSPLAFFSGLKKRGKELPGLSWQLSPGDRILLYTDGVNEAQVSDGVEFGLDRVKAVLDSHIGDDDKTLCESMQSEVDTFLKGEPQFDDITMVSVTYKG